MSLQITTFSFTSATFFFSGYSCSQYISITAFVWTITSKTQLQECNISRCWIRRSMQTLCCHVSLIHLHTWWIWILIIITLLGFENWLQHTSIVVILDNRRSLDYLITFRRYSTMYWAFIIKISRRMNTLDYGIGSLYFHFQVKCFEI